MGNSKYENIPNQLRKHRTDRGYDQIRVARFLGFKSTSILSRWENGKSYPSLVNTLRLAALYKVYVEALYHDLLCRVRADVTRSARAGDGPLQGGGDVRKGRRQQDIPNEGDGLTDEGKNVSVDG